MRWRRNLGLIKHQAVKTYGEVKLHLHEFLTLAQVGGERSTSRSGRFNLEERISRTYWLGGWVGRDGEGKIETRSFRPQPVTLMNKLSQLKRN